MIFDPASQFLDAQGRRLRNPFTGNQLPLNRFDSSSVKLLTLIPHPEGPTAGSLVNNFNRRMIVEGISKLLEQSDDAIHDCRSPDRRRSAPVVLVVDPGGTARF